MVVDRIVLYHGTDLSRAPILRVRSYSTTDFWIAASYGLDKTDQKECYVHEYVVDNPFEIINPDEKHWWNQQQRLDSKYNTEMGHDAFLNNEPLKSSGKKWRLVLKPEKTLGSNKWHNYDITPRPPQPMRSASVRRIVARYKMAVIRKEKGEYCVRSPNNPDWNGGCYPSKEKAEERLREVEYFKHKD